MIVACPFRHGQPSQLARAFHAPHPQCDLRTQPRQFHREVGLLLKATDDLVGLVESSLLDEKAGESLGQTRKPLAAAKGAQIGVGGRGRLSLQFVQGRLQERDARPIRTPSHEDPRPGFAPARGWDRRLAGRLSRPTAPSTKDEPLPHNATTFLPRPLIGARPR